MKVRLKEPITAASTLELPFYLEFKKDAPRNFVLDLSGKASVVHNASILKTTDPEKRLGLRASSSYADMTKSLLGGSNQGEDDGEGFQKIGTERPVSYECRVNSYSSSNQTGAVMLEVVDELPRYRGKNAAGEIRDDLRAQFDPALNPGWELSADGTKVLLKKRFSRRRVGDLPRYQLQLSFPGAAFKQYINNTMQFKFGGDSPHTLNGNWKEANEKFSGAETVYEQELLYENSSSAGVTLLPTKKPEPGTPEPEKPKELPKPAISVYKRCMSFYGSSSGTVFSGQTTRDRHLLYNYNGQQYDWYYPERSIYKPAGDSHYENVFRDNAADRHEEFVWGIRISARAVNARDISLLDYNLDERMRYSAILIPEEFSSAEIIFYSEDEGEGDILLQKQIYGDRFDIPEDVSEQARSFRIAFTGALENKNPWDTSSASMRVYTRLREPDRQHHSSEGADSYGRSKKNYFYNKASVQVEGYTNEGTQLGTLTGKDETEYIIVVPWEERVTLTKTLKDPDKLREANDILNYTLSLTVEKSKDMAMQEFRAVDLLPEFVEPIELKYTPEFKANAVNPRYHFEKNFENTGRYAIIIEADSYNAPGKELEDKRGANPVAFAEITAVTTTDIETKDNQYINNAYVTAKGSGFWEKKSDPSGLKYFKDAGRVLAAQAGFRVFLGVRMKGYKYIKSSRDLNWKPRSTTLLGEEEFSYRLEVHNPTSTTIKGLEIYDVLPYNDDLRIVKNEKGQYAPRGTLLEGKKKDGQIYRERVRLNGPVSFDEEQREDYESFYTTAPISRLKGADPLSITEDATLWQTAEQIGDNWGDVTAFKVRTKEGVSVTGGSRRYVYVPMKAPENPDYLYDDDEIVNSFAYHGKNDPTFVEGNNVIAVMRSPRVKIRLEKRIDDPLTPDKKPLQGAVFRLWACAIEGVDDTENIITVDGRQVLKEPVKYRVNGSEVSEFTTNGNGVILFDELKNHRDYILEELSTKDGYEIENQYTLIRSEQLKKAENGSLTVEVLNKKLYTPVPMTPLTGTLEFYKVDSNNRPLPFTGFTLEGGPEGANHVRRFVLSTETGLVRFENLPMFGSVYPYTLTETTPRGLLQPFASREIRFKNNGGKNAHMDLGSIKNDKATLLVYKLGLFSISEQEKSRTALEKLKSSAGKRLGSVQLQLQSEDGTVLKEQSTNARGEAVFQDLDVDTDYYIAEPEAPEGYKAYENAGTNNRVKVHIDARGRLSVNGQASNNNYLVYPNYPVKNTNRVDILKEDMEHHPLEDTEFQLWEIKEDGGEELLQTQKTGPEGKLSFMDFGMKKLPTGVSVPVAATFEIRESRPRTGYVNSYHPFRFKTTGDNFTYHSLEATNPRVMLTIDKVEPNQEKTPVPGAELSLYSYEGNKITGEVLETVKTDGEGKAVFKYDKFDMSKKYAVKETKIPDGYEETVPGRVEVLDLPGKANQASFDGALHLSWENRKIRGSLRILKFSEDGSALRGVRFSLKKQGAAAAVEGSTDEKGELRFADLEIGETYILNEVETLPGFALGADARDLEIKVTDTTEIVKRFVNSPSPASVSVHKTDDKGHALENISFRLERHIAGPVYMKVAVRSTDENGDLAFEGLKTGDYRLSEESVKNAKIGGRPAEESGAWLGYEKTGTRWRISVQKDPTASGGAPKVTVTEEGQQNALALPLQVVNRRVEPARVKLTVNKSFDGGTNIDPMPVFKVKLSRSDADGKKDADFHPVEELTALDRSSERRAEFTDLDYDYYDDESRTWKQWIYSAEELIEGVHGNLYTPSYGEIRYENELLPYRKDRPEQVNQQSIDIKNSFRQPETEELIARKLWEVPDPSVERPELGFELWRKGGDAGDGVRVTEAMPLDENGMRNFGRQLRTDANGREYSYYVKELYSNPEDPRLDNWEKEERGLTVTNRLKEPEGNRASLRIRKEPLGNGRPGQLATGANAIPAESGEPLKFTFRITGPYGYEKELQLQAGEEAVLENLYYGQYQVEETETHGYEPQYEPENGVLTLRKAESEQLVRVRNLIPENSEKLNVTPELKKIWVNGPMPSVELELWRKGHQVSGELIEEKVNEFVADRTLRSRRFDTDMQGRKLEKYDPSGRVFEYYAKEPNPPAEYLSETEGLTVTNTYQLKYTEIRVSKRWKDEKGETLESHPERVSAELLRNGKPAGIVRVLSNENQWTAVFEHLPETADDGTKYEYSVKEVGEADGGIHLGDQSFHVKTEGSAKEGYILINQLKTVPRSSGSSGGSGVSRRVTRQTESPRENAVRPSEAIPPQYPAAESVEEPKKGWRALPKMGDMSDNMLYALIAGLLSLLFLLFTLRQRKKRQ